ncbi:MAG TPA: hypothetical protein VH413_16180 [Verrucomicrobiae bacterium]|jgi:hypothetical protein|nr:hypothetical protein [Verrucomicrobiae bacterium]
MKTTVAFLQNQWFKDPERVRKMIKEDGEELRLRILEYALFAGCLTGRRLKAAFGELCDEIHWEEISREIGGHASSVFPPDMKHIGEVLATQRPQIILIFGKHAAAALEPAIQTALSEGDLEWRPHLITGPHPAARQVNTIDDLNRMRDDLVRLLNLH